jgi:hypothetical protein
MNSVEEVWRAKTDEQVAEAAHCLEEYQAEGQRVILAELRRRGLPDPVTPPSKRREVAPGFTGQPLSLQDFASYVITSALYGLVVLAFIVVGIKPSIAAAIIPGFLFLYLFQPSVNHFITKPLWAAFTVRDRPQVLGIVCWMTVVVCVVVLGRLLVEFQLSGIMTASGENGGSVLDPRPGIAESLSVRVQRAREVWTELLKFMGVFGVRGLVYLVSAVGMLRGRNWARWIFVGFSCVDWTYSLAKERSIVTAPYVTVSGFALWLVFVYYLTRRERSNFFRKDRSAPVM